MPQTPVRPLRPDAPPHSARESGHSQHTAAQASALSLMKTGRKARINICSTGRLYLPLLTLFSVPPPTLLWLLRLVTLTSTRGWASLRQHHFSMNTQTHTRPHVVIVCPSLRRECTSVWVFPQLEKKGTLCKQDNRGWAPPGRTDGRWLGQFLRPQLPCPRRVAKCEKKT